MFDVKNDIEQSMLIEFGLIAGGQSKFLREQLCEELNIEYTNGKQLLNKLNMYNISKEKLISTMKKIEDNINDRNSK